VYQSFKIKNFRCFRDLTLDPLERVNLIAGMNNVGKTALLEALFLHMGPNNPELPLRVNIFRGIEEFAVDAAEMWGWLFFGKHIDETIELTSHNQEDGSRSLRIRLAEAETPRPLPTVSGDAAGPKVVGSLTTAAGPRELVLEYQDVAGQRSTSRAFITGDGIRFERARLRPFPLGVFLSTRARFPKEDAERFSKLEAVGRQDEILATAKLLEPRLRRLAVLVTGGVPMINGDIDIGQLVPLPFIGEGMVRLLSVVLAIANAPGGVVLVDEMENGLHHSVMDNVWKAVAIAARQAKAQVFATTHSWECIRSAHQAFEATRTYDFRLHRLERVADTIRATSYDQESLAAALKAEIEVR